MAADADSMTTLVTAAQAGDIEAYGRIVRRFQNMAFGYAYALLGNFHRAEEAAQEAFLLAGTVSDNITLGARIDAEAVEDEA